MWCLTLELAMGVAAPMKSGVWGPSYGGSSGMGLPFGTYLIDGTT